MDARGFSHLRTPDQWARARHEDTALDLPHGGVTLAWEEIAPGPAQAPAPPLGAGLGFDSRCRSLRTLPDAGRVVTQDRDLLAPPEVPAAGDFAVAPPADGPLREPRGLAVDDDDRLWVAETGGRRVLLWDLWSRRLLRRIAVPGRPLDLARRGRRVLALLDDAAGIAELEDRAVRRVLPLPSFGPGVGTSARARRLAVSPDGASAVLLTRGIGASAWLIPLDARLQPAGVARSVRRASDVEWSDDATLVVARSPGDAFLRFVRAGGDVVAAPGLSARGYDGLGIARAPGGGIAYGAGDDVRLAVRSQVRFRRRGSVTTYRLDGGAPAVRWGRLFLDACLPDGTSVRARCLTSDEPTGPGQLARTPPANGGAPHAPGLSPPLPWTALLASAQDMDQPLHRRANGRELPWLRPAAADAFETYEAPVMAPPGRYLWVQLGLAGTGRSAPRVRSLRAERPAHEQLERLPRAFSREARAADFLHRYLAMADGVLQELGGRSEQRAVLLSPSGAPAEALGWLAGFLGLVLDERWPEAVRRRVIAETPWLFRYRGTLPMLERLLALLVGRPVAIIERWRLRGLGGALLEGRAGPGQSAVVGGGLRVGGAVGAAEDEPVSDDAFATHAHRFTVLVPALLSSEQLAMVGHALEVHRPAHTVFEICTLGAGMRVGYGLHVGLLSTIGRTGGWEPLVTGGGAVGGGLVGRAAMGTGIGAAAVGVDARVG